MSLSDRIGRSLFVALAVGLGWGIRGDFGHLVGAMYPGAALAMSLAYVSGQRSLFLWMPILAALSGLAIGSGGTMSYGILHGYAQSDTFVNYSYGFLTLFLQGSAWGTFGGGLIGLMLERKPMRTTEWLGLIGSVLAAGWFTSFLLVNVLGFEINPPRNNGSIAFMGAALGQLIWLLANDKPAGLRGAALGYIGFGLGMAGGRLLGNVANVLQGEYNFSINHWNIMEVSCGFIGGFIFCFGMVRTAWPVPPEKDNVPLASFYGIVYALGVIPLWHLLSRIRPLKKPEAWAANLKSYGYENSDQLVQTVLWLLDGVVVFGFIGAAAWMAIHYGRRQRLAAVPVLWLSLTMLLFQSLHALDYFQPSRERYINMHHVLWGMFALMVVYAVVRPLPPPVQQILSAESVPRPSVWNWLGTAMATLALIILLAGFVNGERTMRSANTRWPLWTWSEGPFPGRGARP